jgi:hypothetical protein
MHGKTATELCETFRISPDANVNETVSGNTDEQATATISNDTLTTFESNLTDK